MGSGGASVIKPPRLPRLAIRLHKVQSADDIYCGKNGPLMTGLSLSPPPLAHLGAGRDSSVRSC